MSFLQSARPRRSRRSAVPLLLLYFLKVRRREHAGVEPAALGSRACATARPPTFFQRLQRDPLLILQILALLALTAALARPAITVMGQGDKRVVIVMDSSASMKATDVVAVALRAGAARGARPAGPPRRGRRGHGDRGGRAAARASCPSRRDHDRVVVGDPRRCRRTTCPTACGRAIRTARALVGRRPARGDPRLHRRGASRRRSQAQGDDVRGPLDRRRTARQQRRHHRTCPSGGTTSARSTTQAFISMVNFSPEPQTFSLTLHARRRDARREVRSPSSPQRAARGRACRSADPRRRRRAARA